MIKTGIIGCGGIAQVHGTAYKQIANAELSACCDINIEKGQAFARQYGCKFYADYRDLLADPAIDSVSICTPHYLHKTMAVAALKAGKHVLCEKPMAIHFDEAEELLQLLKHTSLNYAVCFQNRFNETSLKLKELLETSDFGPLKGVKCIVTWHRTKHYYTDSGWRGSLTTEGGGVLINQAIHSLDLINWLIAPARRIKGKVMCTLLELAIEEEDSAMAVAVLHNKEKTPVAIYATNSYSSDPPPEIEFDFEQAHIKLTSVVLTVNGQEVCRKTPVLDSVGKDYWGIGHQKMMAVFLDKVEGIEGPLTQYLAKEDALWALQMVLGIYESSKKNDWFNISN